MKKTLFMMPIVLAILAAVLTACKHSRITPANYDSQLSAQSDQQDDSVPDDSETVSVDGETFKLSYETHHKDMYYKTDIVELGGNTVGALCDISYYKDGEQLFVIHMVYYEAQTIEELMADSDNELTVKTIGGLDYQYFEYDENGMEGRTYAYAYNGTAYTISFASNTDISALENAFMNNVRFQDSEK